jgi:hypothetical protein
VETVSLAPLCPDLINTLADRPDKIVLAMRCQLASGTCTVKFDGSFPMLSDLGLGGPDGRYKVDGLGISWPPLSLVLRLMSRQLDNESMSVDLDALCKFPKTPIPTFRTQLVDFGCRFSTLVPEIITFQEAFKTEKLNWSRQILRLRNIPFERHGVDSKFVDLWIRIGEKSAEGTEGDWFLRSKR